MITTGSILGKIEVLEKVAETGGKCFVLAKDTGSGGYVLEGGAQAGEGNVAKMVLDPKKSGERDQLRRRRLERRCRCRHVPTPASKPTSASTPTSSLTP